MFQNNRTSESAFGAAIKVLHFALKLWLSLFVISGMVVEIGLAFFLNFLYLHSSQAL